MSDFLDAIGVKDPTAAPVKTAPAAKAPQGSALKYEPLEAALRTVYAEAPPDATPEELKAIASVIANRAKRSGLGLDAVVQEPGQFEPWATEAGRKRIAALAPDSPQYQALMGHVAPILQGSADPTVTATHFYAPVAQESLGRAKPAWDDGTGTQIGAHLFFTRDEGGAPTPAPSGDDFLSVLGVDPEALKAAEAASAEQVGAGIVPFKRDEGRTLNKAQTEAWLTLHRANQLDPNAPEGDIHNPIGLFTDADAANMAPGAYYLDEKGRLSRAPGGDEKSSFVAGLGQGVADVATTLGQALPGAGDSEILGRLLAAQMGYGATYGGDTKSGLGRFTGQVAGSIPFIAGAEALAAPALANMGAVGTFLAGRGAQLAPGGLQRFLMGGSSLAAKGAMEGAAGAGLVSSATDRPVVDQMSEGAAGGAALGPLAPAAGAAGRWAGRTARSLFEPLSPEGRERIAGRIVEKFGEGAPMVPDAAEIIPGSVPTLAQATANPGVATLERSVRLARPTPFAERTAQNVEARGQVLDAARGDAQSVADLVAARNTVLDGARERAFANAQPTRAQPIVQAIDEALASPEAHMESVARPLRALRDKVETPPPEPSAAEVAEFNRAVARTFGVDAPALTPDVMSEARAKLGAQFEEIAANTQVAWDDALRNDIGQIIKNTSDVLPESQLPPLFKQLANIASTADGDGKTISGASYQALTKRGSPLDSLMRSGDPTVREAAGRIREALDDALERSIAAMPKVEGAPDPMTALRETRLAYKNLKTAEAALRTAGPDRVVTPRALYNAVKQNFGSYAYQGGGPLGDVAEGALKAQEGRAPQVQTDPRQLFGMRESLSQAIDKLDSEGTDAAHQAATRMRAVRDTLDNAIEEGAPGYSDYRTVAERSVEPIEAQKYLQSLRLTDAQGTVTLGRVNSALERIAAARAKSGKNPAKSISQATLDQLEALRADLLRESSINLGRPLGSDTAQHLVTSNIAGEMGVPLAVGASSLAGHPLVGAALGAGKLFYGKKNEQVLDALARRLLNPDAPGPVVTPSPRPRGVGPLKQIGSTVLPVAGGLMVNSLTGAR